MTRLRIETEGSAEWGRLWEATGREPFAHPSYLGLTLGDDDRAVAVCWGDGGGEVLLPILLRSLPDEPAIQVVAGGWTDAVSPYGYGGPFTVGAPDLEVFFASLLDWMLDERVLTAFLRTSLGVSVPARIQHEGYDVLHLADNVVVGLSRTPEEQWRHYEHKVRKNVNKARRHDLRVEVRDDFGDVSDFLAIYHDTMGRRSADQRYWFGAEYFERLRDRMPGCYWVADVRDADDRIVSTELVLTSDRYCYSFLGGTLADAFPMAPNDLLKHEVIEYARGRGLHGFVLGGGYQPNDGIFRYKRAFDPDGVVAFRGAQLTAAPEEYRALTSARQGADPGSYFPAYRAPR